MTEIEKIIITSSLTIMGGVIVYVTGQLISKFFIEPIHDLCKVIGEVRFNLGFYAPIIHTPIGRTEDSSNKAKEALMSNSCKLISSLNAIPVYDLTRLIAFGVLPERINIEKAAVQLRGLSTHMHEEGEKAYSSIEAINKRVKNIESLLGLKSLE